MRNEFVFMFDGAALDRLQRARLVDLHFSGLHRGGQSITRQVLLPKEGLIKFIQFILRRYWGICVVCDSR